VNELGARSIFSQVDRIKLVHSTLMKLVNFYKLMEDDIATDYYPLHDRFILFGEYKEELFEKMTFIDATNDQKEGYNEL
jgi:hypothetical protein